MKFIVSILLTMVLSFALSLYIPWYAIAIAALLVGVAIPQSGWKSFWSGFIGVFACWTIVSFIINSQNGQLLSTKMAHLFPLQGEPLLLILVGAFIGGLVGGMASLTGCLGRKLVSGKTTVSEEL